MKKITLLILTACSVFTLSSCTVNWFDAAYDVPWYVIAIPVAIIAVISYFILMDTTFVCPDCNTEFKPKKYHLFVTVHMVHKRLAKCPKCGRFGYCSKKR